VAAAVVREVGVAGVIVAEAVVAMVAGVVEAVMEVEVMGTVNVAAAAAVMEVVEVAAMAEEVAAMEEVAVMVEAVVVAAVVLEMGTGETVTSKLVSVCEVVEVSCGGISDGVSDHVSPGFWREEYLRAAGFFGSLKDVKVRGVWCCCKQVPTGKSHLTFDHLSV
jgi:hypothetical protein